MAATYTLLSNTEPVVNSSGHSSRSKSYMQHNIAFTVTNTKSAVLPPVIIINFIRSIPLNLKQFIIKNIVLSKRHVLQIRHSASGHDIYQEIKSTPFDTTIEELAIGISLRNLNGTDAQINFFNSVHRSYNLGNENIPIDSFDFPIHEAFNVESNSIFLAYRFYLRNLTVNQDIEFIDLSIVERLNLASATYEWMRVITNYSMFVYFEY